jgi:hypothetical protein
VSKLSSTLKPCVLCDSDYLRRHVRANWGEKSEYAIYVIHNHVRIDSSSFLLTPMLHPKYSICSDPNAKIDHQAQDLHHSLSKTVVPYILIFTSSPLQSISAVAPPEYHSKPLFLRKPHRQVVKP